MQTLNNKHASKDFLFIYTLLSTLKTKPYQNIQFQLFSLCVLLFLTSFLLPKEDREAQAGTQPEPLLLAVGLADAFS